MPDYYCWTAGCWWSATALTTLSSPPTLGECLKVLANLIFLEVTLKYIRASLFVFFSQGDYDSVCKEDHLLLQLCAFWWNCSSGYRTL